MQLIYWCKESLTNLKKQFEIISYKTYEKTLSIFRRAYYIAKNNIPYSDNFNLLELQKLNGIDIETTFHSRFSYTCVISHIA